MRELLATCVVGAILLGLQWFITITIPEWRHRRWCKRHSAEFEATMDRAKERLRQRIDAARKADPTPPPERETGDL